MVTTLHEDRAAVRIYVLRHQDDDSDQLEWHLLDTLHGNDARGRSETVLSLWLDEHEPMAGRYKAEPNDDRPGWSVHYQGPELAA